MTQPAPIYEYFALAGAGHFSSSALRVVGLKRDELRVSKFVSVGISIWHHLEFWESIPRSAIGIFYQGGLYNNPGQPNTRIHGFGIGGYINTTFFGPIRVDIVSRKKRYPDLYRSRICVLIRYKISNPSAQSTLKRKDKHDIFQMECYFIFSGTRFF